MEIDLRRQLIRRCDLNEAIPPGDDRYVDFDAKNLRGRPWRRQILDTLLLADQGSPTHQVVAGLPGSGKSTELRQLEAELRQQGFDPVLADAGRWVGENNPIEVRDLLLALALALYPEGSPKGMPAKAKEYATHFWNILGAQSKEIEVDTTIQEMGLKATFAVRDTLFQQLAERIEGTQRFVEEVHKLLKKESDRRWKEDGKQLVILLDGVEKRATGDLFEDEKQDTFRNHWLNAFQVHAQELSPPVHVVYTVPPFMLRNAGIVAAQLGEELRFLPMLRIYDHQKGEGYQINTRAVCDMREALFKRVPEQHWESPAVASWLVVNSGGYLRDLLRMTIDCIRECRDAPRIGRAHAEAAVAQIRQTYLYGIEAEQEVILKQVHRERDFNRDTSNARHQDRLLQSHMMLHFRNGNPLAWYDAHPLLWERLGFASPTWDAVAALCP